MKQIKTNWSCIFYPIIVILRDDLSGKVESRIESSASLDPILG